MAEDSNSMNGESHMIDETSLDAIKTESNDENMVDAQKAAGADFSSDDPNAMAYDYSADVNVQEQQPDAEYFESNEFTDFTSDVKAEEASAATEEATDVPTAEEQQSTRVEPTGRDYTTSEYYQKLIDFGIAEPVIGELIEMFDQDIVKFEEFEERTLELIKSLRTDHCTFVLRKFREGNLMGINNVSAYLGSLLKNFKERLRVMGPQAAVTHPIICAPAPESIKPILERTGYSLEVTIGQRKFGGPPPGWGDAAVPGNGCEVYVGKVPREVMEDDLIPLFEECGRMYDLRLMMDPISGYNKGYAFVTYVDRESASAAATKYEGYEIRKGKRLRVNVSIANTRLFIGNIPKSKGKDDIFEEFTKVAGVESIAEVIVYASPDDPERKKNRGFCFLEFRDHKAASQAKRRLSSGRVRPWNCDLVVDWAEPQEEPDDQIMSQVKVVYVRPLKENVTEENLEEKFKEFGEIDRVKKVKDYAFIHFVDRNHALAAIEALNGKEYMGVRVELSLAKPQSERKKRSESNMGMGNYGGSRSRGSAPGGLFGRGGGSFYSNDYYGRGNAGGNFSMRGGMGPRRAPYGSRSGATPMYGGYDYGANDAGYYGGNYDYSGGSDMYGGYGGDSSGYDYGYGRSDWGDDYGYSAGGYSQHSSPFQGAAGPGGAGYRGGRGATRSPSGGARGRSSGGIAGRTPATSGGMSRGAYGGVGTGGSRGSPRGAQQSMGRMYRGGPAHGVSMGTPSRGGQSRGGSFPMKRKAPEFGNGNAKRRPTGIGGWSSRGGMSMGGRQPDWTSDNFADDSYP